MSFARSDGMIVIENYGSLLAGMRKTTFSHLACAVMRHNVWDVICG